MKFKAWVVLITGFGMGFMQLAGMYITNPTPLALLNVIVAFSFGSLTLYLKP